MKNTNSTKVTTSINIAPTCNNSEEKQFPNPVQDIFDFDMISACKQTAVRLKDHPDALEELAAMATANVKIGSQEVTHSKFYQLIEGKITLDASGLGVGWQVIVLVCEITAKSLTLENINLASNKLGRNTMVTVEALIPLKSIKCLDLSSNHMENVPEVAKKIACLSNLETLNLRDDLIEEDAPAVVKALAPLTRLRNLDLSDNLVVKHGPATAKELSNITNLETLNFSGNCAEPSGLETIEALTSLSRLRNLDFSSNELGIDQKGAAATIPRFNSLCYLNLGANHSTYEDSNPNDVTWLQEIVLELVKSPTLKIVALSSHRSSPEQLELAKNAFDIHNSIPYQKNFSLAFGIWCLTQASNYLPKDIAEIIA